MHNCDLLYELGDGAVLAAGSYAELAGHSERLRSLLAGATLQGAGTE